MAITSMTMLDQTNSVTNSILFLVNILEWYLSYDALWIYCCTCFGIIWVIVLFLFFLYTETQTSFGEDEVGCIQNYKTSNTGIFI